jgi:hypothetical protein
VLRTRIYVAFLGRDVKAGKQNFPVPGSLRVIIISICLEFFLCAHYNNTKHSPIISKNILGGKLCLKKTF